MTVTFLLQSYYTIILYHHLIKRFVARHVDISAAFKHYSYLESLLK
jgi:hypothetical protein